MKSKDFEIRTPFLGVGDPLTKSEGTGLYQLFYVSVQPSVEEK